MSVVHKREEAFEQVLAGFGSLQRESNMADTVFRVGNDGNTKDFQVIGALFGIQSPFFKSLLFGRLKESQPVPSTDVDIDIDAQSTLSTNNFLSHPKKFVRIDDLSPDAFDYLKSFFYATKPLLNKTIAPNVVYATKKYLLSKLYELYLRDLDPSRDSLHGTRRSQRRRRGSSGRCELEGRIL